MSNDNIRIHLFLTGEKGVGKSTLIRRLLEKDSRIKSGFFTIRVQNTEDGLWYTHLVRPGERPSGENVLFCCSANRTDTSGRFAELGCSALRTKGELIIMDELGPHEENAAEFQKAVLNVLDGDIPVLGVLQKAESSFLRKVSLHPKVQLVEVSPENREQLLDKLTLFMNA